MISYGHDFADSYFRAGGDVDKLFKDEIAALLLDGKPPEQVITTVSTQGNNLLGSSGK